LRAEIPEIDVVLGTGEVADITTAIGGGLAGRGAAPVTFHRPPRAVALGEPAAAPARPPRPTYLYGASTPRLLTTPKHYAYLKIAEGCDYTCAFCIIPTLRGSYRSRDEDSVVAEAERLAAGGVRELLLISQDTTFFGNDRGLRNAIGRLLRRLNEIDGLVWIRLLYLYPTTVTDDLLDVMAECEKVCRYIDLPLQHASADVLRRMRRPGARLAYDKLLARARARVPGVTLRTTFIVGFPGETARDFAELEAFVRETAFEHVGVFTYSHEEGTRAHALTDDVPAALKAERRDRLMQVQRDLVAQRHASMIGRTTRVIVDGPSPETPLVLEGRLEGQAPDIDSVVYFDECDASAHAPGSLVDVELTGARGYDFIAVPFRPAAS
jgi:ribosomal protein S12 methylthiotransferase